MTLVETTGPLFGQGPLLVIYDIELFFEENDVVRIETSQGARVFTHPSLEEFERDGWVRLYKVHESGSYKIRVTTGHGAERLFVNIYRISSETYYRTITFTTMNYTGHATVSNITSLNSETFNDTWINNASSPTSSTLQMEGVVEVIPGYSFYAVVIGIFVGAIITLLTRRSNYNSTRT